jgi:hypothetical protein
MARSVIGVEGFVKEKSRSVSRGIPLSFDENPPRESVNGSEDVGKRPQGDSWGKSGTYGKRAVIS